MRESVERETVGGEGSPRVSTAKKKGFFHHLDRITTSFFFTNLPDDANSEDLWKLFLKFGRVAEVYIPKKLDKRGMRFGFVKFKDVAEVEALSDRLKDVWIGSFKLWVNRSRFGRSESKEFHSPKTLPLRPESKLVEAGEGRSFRSALLGGGSWSTSQTLKVPVNEELCKELQGSVVGMLAREKDVRRIQTTLFMEGFGAIKVTHMGGNIVLIRSVVAGDVDRLLKSKNECLPYYFSDLKPWNPGMIAAKREVWVQIYGIPLHIWGKNLFKLIGNRIGAFVDFDDETARLARFDMARIKIATEIWASIDTELKVEVEGVSFTLWLVEERDKKGSMVVLSGEEVSQAASVVAAGVEEVASDGNGENSGEDDVSGDECEVDMRVVQRHGEIHDVNCVRNVVGELPKEGDIILTCGKSTKEIILEREIPPVTPGETEKVELGVSQGEKEIVLELSTSNEEREGFFAGGTT
jgi:hypothetical protein